MAFESLPYEPRVLEATEARLVQIYEKARLGLKGDALAFALDMTPGEYRALISRDAMAQFAEDKGRAEAEVEMANVLRTAALAGDTKAALDILKHVHGWVAKQAVSVEVNQNISITAALEEATTRVIEGSVLDTVEAADATTSNGLLGNRNGDGHHAQNYARQIKESTDL
jgi:hypothetical protein